MFIKLYDLLQKGLYCRMVRKFLLLQKDVDNSLEILNGI